MQKRLDAAAAPHAAPLPIASPDAQDLREHCLPEVPTDDSAAEGATLKLTVLESCSTTASGATSPTCSTTVSGASSCGHDIATLQSADGAVEPRPPSEDTERPPRESAIQRRLRHLNAVEVLNSKGKFLWWTPTTMEGMCGHPCPDGNLCNNIAGDCSTHRRREQSLLTREDESAAIMEHGHCGVPCGNARTCEKPWGRCNFHSEAWHKQRELRAMEQEDRASCIEDRGVCGAVQRNGDRCCGNPKGRCPNHAEEKVRFKSAIDSDPVERCWNRRMESSDFCEKHVDYSTRTTA